MPTPLQATAVTLGDEQGLFLSAEAYAGLTAEAEAATALRADVERLTTELSAFTQNTLPQAEAETEAAGFLARLGSQDAVDAAATALAANAPATRTLLAALPASPLSAQVAVAGQGALSGAPLQPAKDAVVERHDARVKSEETAKRPITPR